MHSGLLKFGVRVQAEWREFERRSTDIPNVLSEYCLATELKPRFWEHYTPDALLNKWKRKREMIYLSLRRRFVDVKSNHPDPNKCLETSKEYQINQDLR